MVRKIETIKCGAKKDDCSGDLVYVPTATSLRIFCEKHTDIFLKKGSV